MRVNSIIPKVCFDIKGFSSGGTSSPPHDTNKLYFFPNGPRTFFERIKYFFTGKNDTIWMWYDRLFEFKDLSKNDDILVSDNNPDVMSWLYDNLPNVKIVLIDRWPPNYDTHIGGKFHNKRYLLLGFSCESDITAFKLAWE